MFIDADACPVKEDIVRLSIGREIQLHFVASYDHQTNAEYPNAKWSFVDPGPDSTDFFILKHIKKSDLLITQDIGLASLALGKGAYALSPKGSMYKHDSIETALNFRYLAQEARRAGIYEKGPKPFSKENREQFQNEFLKILSKIEGDLN